jgi:hypothetical protein
MNVNQSVAAALGSEERKRIGLLSLVKATPISQLADQEGVSRQFVHRQRDKVMKALDRAFAANDEGILFTLPVTQSWLDQLMLSLALICRGSFRGVKEVLRDMLDVHVSLGTIHNRIQCAARKAATINCTQDLSNIRVGLQDEIFQGAMPVLAGVDAASSYCYLLAGAEHRDADTWAVHLLDACAQGFAPDHTIADAGQGLRAGQKVALENTPCHGDVFHIEQQCQSLANVLGRLAKGAVSRRNALEIKMAEAKASGCGNTLSREMTLVRQAERSASQLARDIKTLTSWLSHDVLALAGPDLAARRELFDFIVAQLRQREHLDLARIRPVRKALQNQRDDLLGFAGVLDVKLADIATGSKVPLELVRSACLLQSKSPLSSAYWARWNRLRRKLTYQFHHVIDAVVLAMTQIPRASSLVENLNSRLRTYFTLRRQLGAPYLGLLQLFLNHRTFLRSRRPERVGKSPTELMTGYRHSHWLELLGFTRFRRT